MAIKTTENKDYVNNISEISVDVICILESKLEVILTPYDHLGIKKSDIFSVIGSLSSFLITLLTADFDSEIWKGFFISISLISFYFLGTTIYEHYKNKISAKKIIDNIKAEREVGLAKMKLSTSIQSNQNPKKKSKKKNKIKKK